MRDLASRLTPALADRYAIEREVGSGGTAIVYLARDLKHGRLVALKVLRPDVGASLGADRFLREIRIAAGLNHPHILAVHDSGEAAGLLYYVMPFVEGESLRDRLKREGALPLDDALRIGREVADALQYAHSQGVVHRDIKPGNILLVGGHAVVADFGIAMAAGGEADVFTELGLVIGTPAYMSPEQGGGAGPLDGRTDLYSLGCVLYEMLTGEPPFTGSPQEVMARHATASPPPVRAARPSVPLPVDAAVRRALAKLPADRFATANQFAEALGAAPLPRRARGRRVLFKQVAVGVGLLTLGIAGLAIWRGRRGEPDEPAGLAVAVLPLGGDSLALSADAESRAQRLLGDAIGWLPGVRAMEGRGLASANPEWRAGDFTGVLRGARRAGAQYLVATAVRNVDNGLAVSAEVYRAGQGERILKAEETAGPDSLALAVDRVARDVIGIIVEQEKLLAGDRRWVLAATTSARALGQLVQGQAAFERGEFDDAAKAFSEAVEADPACGLCYHRLSIAHEWRHDFDSSMAAVTTGLRQQRPLHAHSGDLLAAQRYYMLGQGDSAIAAFQEIVLDHPDASDAWLGLAESLFHYAGYSRHRAADARPAFIRLYALDSAFAPITCYHLVDLAIIDGKRAEARAWLDLIPAEHPWRRMREAGFSLRFGDSVARRSALEQLKGGTRQAIAQLAQIWMHGPLDPHLADTLGSLLITPRATPADRLRGAQYRFAALATLDRWPEAMAAWNSVNNDRPFDAWMVQASFAGFPADSIVAPMLAYAGHLVDTGQSPDFRRAPWDPLQEPFFALVHRAIVDGDSASVTRLLNRVIAAPTNLEGAYPMAGSLRSALEARLALLAADTAAAVAALQQAVSRVHGPADGFFPMTSMAPERLLLASLLAATGDRTAANQWLGSFSETWAVGDAMFSPRVRALRARLAQFSLPRPAERPQ